MANRNKKTQKKYEGSSKKKFDKSSKKSNNERDPKEFQCEEDSKKRNKSWNDAGWYIPDENLRNQVGTYAVNTVTGIPQYIDTASAELVSLSGLNRVEYGDVMSITLFPYPGTGTSLTSSAPGVSALDTACRKLYTAISSVNSKTTQYTPESLGIAIIALGELISLISYATRLYGVAFTYNPRNRFVPKQVIMAMGMNDSILDDLALYRMQLNKLITAANNVRMLKDLKYFTKCWELYANYYEDSSSGLAQYYVMRPGGYLRYDETSPTTGELIWVPFATGMTYPQLIGHIQTCLNNLLTSSLMNYVYTDIVNYVTKEGGELLGFSYVGELYSVLPTYDQTFLTQTHNMTWGMFDLSGYRIYEDPNTLEIETTDIFNAWSAPAYRMANAGDRIVDFPFTDNPSVDDKIDAVMYMSLVWDIDANGKPLDIAAPDHPVLDVTIYPASGSPAVTITQCPFVKTTMVPDYIGELNLVKTFEIAPILYPFSTDTQTNHLDIFPHGSFNYFTVFRYKQLKNIFDFSFLGLFDAAVKSVHPY